MYPLLLTRTPDGVLHASPVDMGRFDRDLTGHNGYIFVRKASDGLRKGSTITVEIRDRLRKSVVRVRPVQGKIL